MPHKTLNQYHVTPWGFMVVLGVCACGLWVKDYGVEVAAAQVSKSGTARVLSVSTARVEDLSWLEGTWRSARKVTSVEQRWSAPLGDSLVGTFRSYRRGQAWMYELMTISKDRGRLFLWLKHFSRKLASWEEKDEALTFALTHIETNKVVFLNVNKGNPQRVTYYRPVPETLVVRLEGTEEGEATMREFQFSRVGP